MRKTAIEWLVEQMKKCNMTVSVHNTSHQNVIDFYKAIKKAKEMEKDQIKDAYETSHISMMTSEQYYNEKFKKE